MAFWQKLTGTTLGAFIIGLTGVRLKNSSGNLQVRNNGDTGFADAAVKDLTVSNNTTGFDVTVTTSGSQPADYTLTLPTTAGSPGQVLQTNGSGVLNWVSAASTADAVKVNSTTLNFGDIPPVAMFTLPANAVVHSVRVINDTPFDGTPSMSVGISGNASKYLGSGDVALTFPAETVFETNPGKAPVGGTEALEIAYSAGGATTGTARVEVHYSNPD